MGLESLPEVRDRLLAEGYSPDTPAAVVANGTTPGQEVVVSDLASVVEDAAGLSAPALVVVGEVVALRDRLLAGQPAGAGAARHFCAA
jgi:siroheme synthase